MSISANPPAHDARVGRSGPSRRLVGALELLAVAALCGAPGTGPETWLGVADGGPLGLVARSAGPAGLGLLHAVALVVLAGLVRTTVVGLADPLRRLAALVLALVAATAVPVGPRLLGLLLAALCLMLWRRPPGRALLAVPVLVALWATVDPSWVLGPVLGAVALTGTALDRGRRADGARLLVLVASLGAGLVVSAVRVGAPHGPVTDVLRSWATALWSGPVAGGAGPAPLTQPLTLVVVLPLLLVVGRWLRVGRPSWESVCWAGLALLLAVGPAGPAAAAGIVAAPVVAEALGGSRASTAAARPTSRSALVLLVAFLVGAPLAAVTTSRAAAQDPVTGLRSALRALPAATPVVADPRYGPRAAAGTGADVVRLPDDALLTALRAEPGWRAILQDSGTRAALLTDDAPLLAALQERLGWRVTARSGPLVLVLPPEDASPTRASAG